MSDNSNPWFETRTREAVLFWIDRGLPRWEQKTFSIINAPFAFVAAVLSRLLGPIYRLAYAMVIPGMILMLLFSVLWLPLLGLILGLSYVTERCPFLRPLSFMLALPLLVTAYVVVTSTPIPPSTERDLQAHLWKWDIIETFPLSWSLVRAGSEIGPIERS